MPGNSAPGIIQIYFALGWKHQNVVRRGKKGSIFKSVLDKIILLDCKIPGWGGGLLN